jgi:alkaline phosphatase D
MAASRTRRAIRVRPDGDRAERRLALALAVLATSLGCASLPGPDELVDPRATHGVAIGEVGPRGALVWARTDRPARMRLVVERVDVPTPLLVTEAESEVDSETDYAGRIALDGLRPETAYRAVVRFTDAEGRTGSPDAALFRTAPRPRTPAPVRLAWGGDLAGQGVCRDAREGFPVLGHVLAERPDLFIGLGDMIYADDVCHPIGLYANEQVPGEFGPAADLDGFRAHWRYNREDAGLRVLLATTPYVAVWDDHEIANDAGPHHDTRDEPPYRAGIPLLPLARRAFLEWNPLPEGAPLFRRLRWGRHLELFVLDTRSYRDPNGAPDTGTLPKTLLGAAQRRWLENGLQASRATWKVVVSSVPLSVPTGSMETGRDGWAAGGTDGGFARELLAILEQLQHAGVRNLIWLTTDVHFAGAFRYAPFPDAPDFRFYEFLSGPLNAGLFPNPALDRTLGPQRLLYYAPADADDVTSFAEAKRWFNFGVLDIGADGALTARIVNGFGEEVFRLTLDAD